MSLSEDRRLLRRLRDLPPPPIPPGLEARLLAGIPAQAGAPARRRWLLRPRTLAASAAAAAVLVTTAVWRPGPGRTASPPPPQTLNRDVHPQFVQQPSV